jgi:cellulose synthase operon protein C
VTYNLRAAIFMGKGDVPAARKSLERAVELQPNYYPAVTNLAVLDERNNDLDGARKRYRALLAKEPGNLAASLALAQFETRHGAGPDVVLPLLKEAKRVNPNSEQPVVALAAFYVSRNDPKQALTVAQEGLAQSPNSPGLLALVGQIMVRTGSTDQAIAIYRKRVGLNPDSVPYQMDLGKALVAANQSDAAFQTFQTVLKKNPDVYEAQAAAVGTLLRANKLDEAATLITTLRQQSPKSPVLPELDGDVKLANKQYGEAAGVYRQLLARTPSSNLVIKAYTAILLGGHAPEADAFLADWIKTHPKDLPVRLFDADLALRAKNYTHAAAGYRAALEIRPNDPALLNNLAWTLWQMKDPQALAYAQKASAAAPDSPAINDTLGWMLVEQGQTKRGLELLQKASAAAPAQRDIALHLAKAQIKDGNKDAARSTLQALVKAAPDSAEGKESKDLMATL